MIQSIGRIGRTAAFVVLVGAVGWSLQSAPDDATPLGRAQQALKQGNLDGALELYGEASRAPDATPATQQRFVLLRRTIQLKGALASETDTAKWSSTAETLRSSFYSLRVYGELLAICNQLHERKHTAATAAFVADALLLLERGADAEKVLSDFGADKLGTQGKILHGIALGKQKKLDAAKSALQAVQLPEAPSPRMVCDVARLKVLCGDIEGGMATLTEAITKTSPKAIASFRDFLGELPEFASLPESAGFAKVLATKPAAAESDCSAGPDCGKCPKKDDCPTGSGAGEKKD